MDIENIRKNVKILIDGIPYRVEETEFMKPGKGSAIYRLKLRNLQDNSTLNRTYRSNDKVQEISTTTEKEQFLYQEGEQYIFMNSETFEQDFINADVLGENRVFLKEGMIVTVMKMGEKPLEITLPTFVELKVVETAAGSKTDTVTAQMRRAQLETGASIDVPTFVQEGDTVKVDTRTGGYVERVAKK